MNSDRRQLTDALAEVEELYSSGLRRHGAVPHSVGWKDELSQTLRFSKLAEVLKPLTSDPITVNDFGCGYGAFFSYLTRLPGVKLAKYYGYDLSEPMLEAARAETDSRAHLVLSSAPTFVADYSFVCGTFNVKGTATDELWNRFIIDTILELAAKSRLGFAFNLLTTFVDFKQAHLFYADPSTFFSLCKQQISPYVSLLHDYPLYEWTMLVRLPPAVPALPDVASVPVTPG